MRLADATGAKAEKLPESIGGLIVDLTDPSGVPVRVVADTHELAGLPAQPTQVFNFGHDVRRANATQRPPREPAKVQRLGHVVLQTTKYIETLNWYLEHLGLIVSDFKYYEGQRERGPTMSFIRCDRGATPTDHHTLAMALGPRNRYVHSAYQVADLDALGRGWGVPPRERLPPLLGDRSAYRGQPDLRLLARPGRPAGRALRRRRPVRLHPGARLVADDGLGAGPVGPAGHQGLPRPHPGPEALRELASMARALRDDNEFDLTRLRGLLKVTSS